MNPLQKKIKEAASTHSVTFQPLEDRIYSSIRDLLSKKFSGALSSNNETVRLTANHLWNEIFAQQSGLEKEFYESARSSV